MSGPALRSPDISVGIDIDAPVEAVWTIMADLKRYHEWNPFIVAIDHLQSQPSPGDRMRLHVRWQNGKTVRSWETLTCLDGPKVGNDGRPIGARLSYRYSDWLARAGLVKATRLQEIVQMPDGRTRYSTEESFDGLLSIFVPVAKVEEGFRRHALALKTRAETLAAGRSMPPSPD